MKVLINPPLCSKIEDCLKKNKTEWKEKTDFRKGTEQKKRNLMDLKVYFP